VAALVLVFAAPAAAEERIAVLQDRTGEPAAWTMRPDGSQQRTVSALDSTPTSDPEEQTLAVVAPNGHDYASFTFNHVVSDVEVIVNDRVVGGADTIIGSGPIDLVYAPSGTKAVLISDLAISVISLPSGAVTKLGPLDPVDPDSFAASREAGPVWSPDESRFAFLLPTGIFVSSATSPGTPTLAAALPPLAGDASLSWTPDGKGWLVADRHGLRRVLPGVTPAVSVRTTLAAGPAFVTEAASSPDGTKIALVLRNQLTVIDADGSHPVRIGGGAAAWSPDSQRLAFPTVRHGVEVVNADGTHRRRITSPAAHFIAVTGWLKAAETPTPDRTAPQAFDVIAGRRHLRGGFVDGVRSSPVVAARISVVRRVHGRCVALTHAGFRTAATCRRAARTFVTARLVTGPNGTEWRIRRHLPRGRYTIRVRARDAAGNTTTPPTVLHLSG
jgi:hypothetical protein